MPAGLYVHIPFCSSICDYCNFNRGLYDDGLKDRYLAALLRELATRSEGIAVDTIFFGGGTPSLLDPGEIAEIIEACGRSFSVDPGAEITLEANPETATDERLAGCRHAGVNRLSFGVQSFSDEELKGLGRVHSARRAREAFGTARLAGFENISLDLMMWLPRQSLADWLYSVESLIELGPDHASLYLLELYPNAPLRENMARAQWSQAPDDDAAEMYLQAMARLEEVGYRQYEISNVARPGRESRHNLKYWTDGEWLGVGCGAHSTRRGVRSQNVASVADYMEAIEAGRPATGERREMSDQECLEEALFTGLRLTRGIDLAAVESTYGVDVWARFGPDLRPFVEAGLLIYDGRAVRLTRPGMLLAHEIMIVLIGEPVR